MEVLNKTKLLGTIITSDLRWNENTDKIVKDANKRMKLLHVASKFINNNQDLVYLYKTFVRSVLEVSAVVWHSSLSKINSSDLERVQKSALKVILKENYKDYKSALSQLNLQTLSKRREILCLKFAKKCLKLEKFKNLFPLNKKLHNMSKRKGRKFFQVKTNTERYMKSSIPYMQKLLNKEDESINKLLSQSDSNSKIFYASELCLQPADSITIDNLNYNK